MGSFEAIHDDVAALVTDLDPEALSGGAARSALTAVLATEKLLGAARLLLAGRVSKTGSWSGDGARSFEDWLTCRTGGSFGTARRDAETAQALSVQSELAGALREGAISTEQAAAVSLATRSDPASEPELVDRARRETLRQTRLRADRVRASARTAEEDAARERRQRQARRVRFGHDADGCWTMDAVLPPQAGAEVQAELERLTEGVYRVAHRSGGRDPQAAYRADALVELARRSRSGGAGTDGCDPPKPKVAISVVVDLPALRRRAAEPGEHCEIPGIGPVPVGWAVEQLGEATLRLFLRHGDELRTMASASRAPTERMKVALDVLYDGCVVCGSRHCLEIHHTTSSTGWADTGRTALVELAPLCRHHHDLVTTSGWRLEPGHMPFSWILAPPSGPGPPRAVRGEPGRLPPPPNHVALSREGSCGGAAIRTDPVAGGRRTADVVTADEARRLPLALGP